MKKTAFVLLLLLLAAGLFAQKEQPATVTVSGKLALVKGRIALQNNDDVYYVQGIQRLVGFIDGLKEGAQVSMEGYTRDFPNNEKTHVLWAVKLTISGKSYDLAGEQRNFGALRQGGPGWGHPMMQRGWKNRGRGFRPW